MSTTHPAEADPSRKSQSFPRRRIRAEPTNRKKTGAKSVNMAGSGSPAGINCHCPPKAHFGGLFRVPKDEAGHESFEGRRLGGRRNAVFWQPRSDSDPDAAGNRFRYERMSAQTTVTPTDGSCADHQQRNVVLIAGHLPRYIRHSRLAMPQPSGELSKLRGAFPIST